MCVYIYIYIYVCVCVCVCAYIYIYIYQYNVDQVFQWGYMRINKHEDQTDMKSQITYLQNTTSHSISVMPAYLEHNTHKAHHKLQDFMSHSLLIYDRQRRTHVSLLSDELSEAPGWVHPVPLVSHRLQFHS